MRVSAIKLRLYEINTETSWKSVQSCGSYPELPGHVHDYNQTGMKLLPMTQKHEKILQQPSIKVSP